MKRIDRAIALTVLAVFTAAGQTSGKASVFESADVHLSKPGTQYGAQYQPGRVEFHAATMLQLITTAYRVEDDTVVGGPPWLNTNKYDLIAIAPAETRFDAFPAMIKSLLIERFKLVTREEKRDQPVYVMTVSKKGSRLQAAAEKDGPPRTARGEGDPAINNHILFRSYTMGDLASFLPQGARNFVDHPVVDETGLKGAFDFQLDWMGKGIFLQAKANAEGPPAVSAFDAVEKLGLKLELGRLALPALVVVSVNESPNPNPPGTVIKAPVYPTEFELAEVRPAKNAPTPGTPSGNMTFQNGRIEIMWMTLRTLVSLAYQTGNDRIVGTAKWMDDERFDVIAKTSANVPFEGMMVMLKNVLRDRFKLVTHEEEQPMPVFVLLAGKKPRLKPADGSARSECKVVQVDGVPTFACQNTTMAELAERLPRIANAYLRPPMLDLTGLKGGYDFQLHWTSKAFLPGARIGGNGAEGAAAPAGDLTVFEALDKQLGLKAEEQRHPVPVLVVDRAERVLAN